MSYYQVPQGAGRYMVPWYFPVQHPLYPNYPVDPNHPHWIPAHPYGNAPIVNGRQSENDGSEGDSNVDDERSGGATAGYPPPGVGLPAASTMQQQPVYQMMPPFSNVYVGSVPSAVNVQGFVNSPIPYPHPYSAIPPSAELATPPNNASGGRGGSGNRSGGSGAGGKAAAGSGGKMSADKGLQNSADSSPYNAAGGPLPPPDANTTVAANDPSAPTLPPTLAPPPHPHPQANLMPFGAMQYGYSYFPQAGHHPPPPHLTSAQHAAGSPLYIPHPTMPVYHAPIYSSGPATAVFSTDNGLPPHSAVSAAPISIPPPADLVVASHEVEATAAAITTTANTSASASMKASPVDSVAPTDAATNASADDEVDQCKQSNLMVDSVPYQPDSQKSGTAGFKPDSTLTVMNASTPVGSTENVATVGLHAAGVAAETEKQSSIQQNSNTVANEVAPLLVVDNADSEAVVEKVDSKTEKGAYPIVGENNVSIGRKANTKEATAALATDKDKAVVVSSAIATPSDCLSNIVKGTQLQSDCGDHATVETASRTSDSGSNESKSSSSPESMNGKSNSSESANSSGFESGVSKLSSTAEKEETSEESSPPPSAATKTWASLFKGPSSSSIKSKASPAAAATIAASRLSSNDTSANSLAAPSYATQNVDSAIHSSSSSLAGHTSSLNGGMPVAQSAIKSPSYRYSSSSSMSLADDTALPKIGELLKNYKLDHRAVNFEPRGLDNRSNFCYVNAILQALLACPPFYNLMKCISHNLHNTKTKLASKQHFPIIDSMVQFVDEFKLISQKARRDKVRKVDAVPHLEIQPGKSFEPNSMYNVLSVIQNNSVFTMGQQEDAQEFLTCLLNGLNDEMVELIQLADGTTNNGVNPRKIPPPPVKPPITVKNNKKLSNGDIASEVSPPDDSDSEWKQVHSKIKPHRTYNLALTRTPLSEIFRGQMRSRVQKVGDSATNNIEPFFTLHLNIEKANSVKDALDLLVNRDALEGVTSSRTNQEVDAWQQQTLEELPFVLLLHLKYFDFKHHTCTKIMKSIEFPIDLKLEIKLISSQSALRMKTTNSKSRQYKLFAVVYHDGKEASKGHYITDVFHIGYGGWIRYDDSRVYTVSENDVLKPRLPRVPYLLYYRRCDTIAALMQPPFEKRPWW